MVENLLHTLRQLALHSDDPLKGRILNLYMYCDIESEKVNNENLYGSNEWVNMRTAVRNFLVQLVKFDLEKWESRELSDA